MSKIPIDGVLGFQRLVNMVSETKSAVRTSTQWNLAIGLAKERPSCRHSYRSNGLFFAAKS
jgi:hypothetical protein